ncbi:unknown [Alistipes finegoldii CAG:68]|nr:unknown [Alistipes finegoldii CAG:68]
MLRYAEVLDRVDVAVFEVERRVAAVTARHAPLDGHHTCVAGGDRGHDDRAAVHVGDPLARVEAAARHAVPERMAERVDDVALESVGRVEQFVDDEFLRERGVDAVEVYRVQSVLGGHRFAAYAFDAVVDEELGVGQPRDVAAHETRELGVDLPDAGNQAQPYLVAQVLGRAVRRILPEGDAVGDGVLQNLLARSEHQRSDDLADLRRNARQPAQARAAQQVDEERLDRVVGMVGDRHHRVAVFAAQGVEPCVAQPPGGHLHRLARALHFGRRFEAFVVELDAVFPCLFLHQHLILVALRAPQLEIAVRHADPVAAAREERQHDHRVHAARNGQQNAVVVRRQIVVGDVFAESL